MRSFPRRRSRESSTPTGGGSLQTWSTVRFRFDCEFTAHVQYLQMTLDGLDELDHHILSELQDDARHVSSRDIAEKVSASPSTVRKRIQRLEDKGIITAYRPEIDYERAGYRVYFQIVCTAPIPDRAVMADNGLNIPGVISVRELATGERNVVFTVAGEDSNDLTRIAAALSEIGLTILDEELIRRNRAGQFFESTSDRRRSRERSD